MFPPSDAESAIRAAFEAAEEFTLSSDADEVVDHISERFALVVIGGTAMVIEEAFNEDGRPEPRFLKLDTFITLMRNRFVEVANFEKERKWISWGRLWLASKKRRTFTGITFAPPGIVCHESYYNLWRGFAVEPKPGDCSLFTRHVMDNICDGDPAKYDYVIGWFAHLIQKPHEKLGTSIVLRGRQGTGKTKVGEIIGSLVSPHYSSVADPRFITGQFNSHLATCLLLHADEGFWAGDRAAEGKLKDLITGRRHYIEMKGKEPFAVRNLVRLLVTSNHDWTVPAGLEERRFAVFDMGEDHMQDHGYFAAIDRQMNEGGREALMHMLQSFDLSSVDLSLVPDTPALFEQKIATLSPIEAWWLDRLRSGAPMARLDGWPEWVTCDELVADYVAHADRVGVTRKSNETQLGIALKRLVSGIRRTRRTNALSNSDGSPATGRRETVYLLPPLKQCQSDFERLLNGNVSWDIEA